MKQKQTWIIAVVVITLLFIVGYVVLEATKKDDNGNLETLTEQEDTTEEEIVTEEAEEETGVEEEVEEEVIIEEAEEEVAEEVVPDWYGKTYKIDSADFEGLSYQKVNLWKSYDERTLIIAVPRYADVILRGYRSDYDYCELEYQSKVGWSACAWVKGLPEDMVDYWVE